MTRKWWYESNLFDDGMWEWGGENIEQSLRCWLCGGDIVVAREAHIGHIFHRVLTKDRNSPRDMLGANKARAGIVWLDDFYQVFSEWYGSKRLDLAKPANSGGNTIGHILERILYRFGKGCTNFNWWLIRFYKVFEENGLIEQHHHHIKHVESGLCLEA
jgi:polypeptide N-acetylgalactosaminyltransferase